MRPVLRDLDAFDKVPLHRREGGEAGLCLLTPNLLPSLKERGKRRGKKSERGRSRGR